MVNSANISILLGRWGVEAGAGSATSQITRNSHNKHRIMRYSVGKASNRTAVHGAKLPVAETIANREEVEEEIDKEKKKKMNKREEVEKKVDSGMKHSDLADDRRI